MEKIVLGLDEIENTIKVSTDFIKSYYTHTHMYNEMLVYEPFEGYVTVNNEKIQINSTTLLIVTTTDFHSTTVMGKSDARYIKIAFGDDVLDGFLLSALSQPIVYKNMDSNIFITELINRINGNAVNQEKLRIFINAVLLELTEKGTYIGRENKKNSELLVLQAVHTINEHFFENINLKTVAEAEHITPQHLSFLFSKYMGISFSEYLCEMRLRYASILLSEHKYNVTEVCYRCGYGNLSHFLRSFKKKHGITPKAYQNLNV